MNNYFNSYPRRIICLTEETTETLYLLGEQDRIVGVSGYTVRPPEARQKPKVSAFINAKFDKILALKPDLVLAFSPLFSGISWVDELIEVAGGASVFPELRQQQSAKDRVVNPADVIGRDPQVIIGSWCGRQVKKNLIRARNGWESISAVRDNHIYEVKSPYRLQPGPAALTEGLRQLHAILSRVVNRSVDPELLPRERCDASLELAA